MAQQKTECISLPKLGKWVEGPGGVSLGPAHHQTSGFDFGCKVLKNQGLVLKIEGWHCRALHQPVDVIPRFPLRLYESYWRLDSQ
jgi:hypothetical protein